MCFVETSCFIIGRTTPSVSIDGIGTIQKFEPVVGADYIKKDGIQIQIPTKLYNLCAMLVYQSMSMEVQKKSFIFEIFFRFLFRNYVLQII
jgi:hypothetical protein